jgi:2-aminomuconate deaminase
MTEQRSVVVAGAAAPRGAYPHLRVAGDMVFVSGASSRRPDGVIEGRGDIRVQTRAVLGNIATLLADVGLGLADLVDVTTFLVSMDDFDGYNEVYGEHFQAATGPARTTVAVHQLPHPDLLIEIKATGVIQR